jgi:hypothetical protein
LADKALNIFQPYDMSILQACKKRQRKHFYAGIEALMPRKNLFKYEPYRPIIKLRELVSFQSDGAQRPIGSDVQAHRLFFVFSGFPGVFVPDPGIQQFHKGR